MSLTAPVQTVVFDIGGVLIDWDPRYLYRKLIPDVEEMERFLSEICSPAWHRQHDLGASYEDTVPALVAQHPAWAEEILAWNERFAEMYGGPIDGTVALLQELHRGGTRLLASTNWGAESWRRITGQYAFFDLFEGALVSGQVGLAKPDPAFFDLLIATFSLVPATTLYVEDTPTNLDAAASKGFITHLFTSPGDLAVELDGRGLVSP